MPIVNELLELINFKDIIDDFAKSKPDRSSILICIIKLFLYTFAEFRRYLTQIALEAYPPLNPQTRSI
jgi:hypothetical protein